MYPEATTTASVSDNETEFTTIEYEEVTTVTSDDEHSENVTANTASGSTFTIATRRHHYPTYLPILLLLRYMSTIWMSELVCTGFATPGIHHSAVSCSL